MIVLVQAFIFIIAIFIAVKYIKIKKKKTTIITIMKIRRMSIFEYFTDINALFTSKNRRRQAKKRKKFQI